MPASAQLKAFMVDCQTRCQAKLTQALDAYSENAGDNPSQGVEYLQAAMRYSLLSGGKRMRPMLVYAAADAVGMRGDMADACACALECIHAYSLVHDDLPAMDDDALRRGQASCHIAFNEATAILVGDALQCLAFELIAASSSENAAQALRAAQVLAKASGARGMVMGQSIDLHAVEQELSLAQLENMHRLKTGALIEASVHLGGICAKASTEQLAALRAYAQAIGLAFQVQDDIIDITSDTHTLGKPQGADAKHRKPTYVSLLGMAGAKQKAQELKLRAHEALTPFDNGRVRTLRDLANYIVERNR